jgi:hypothetical protein
MTIRPTRITLICVTPVHSTHSDNGQCDLKTDEQNTVTAAGLNTYTLPRLKTVTLDKIHSNFNFPQSNDMLFILCPCA